MLMEKILLLFLLFFGCKNQQPILGVEENSIPVEVAEQQYDGPYVQYVGNQVWINYIDDVNGEKRIKKEIIPLRKKDNVSLKVMTDLPGKSFKVDLKKQLKIEPGEFSSPAKLMVLSDIEGNFEAVRKLLQAHKIIDEDLKWKFDGGHLVLVGDFFDRGQQVTEVLWLIYSLEEKAKANGGYVHFILGNHEIMNLSNDLRYLNKKYVENAALLNLPYGALYGEDTELGRWLRTKNIVEKIGNLLVTHGGISSAVTKMNISVPEINKLARPYYADTNFHYDDPKSDVLFSDLGPFWYRGYYEKNDPSTIIQIDSTLSQFKVNHIITGHSIVADTVSVWYGGKLFNTDVPHASGKSEALLIEKEKFYRVNREGRKVLVMDAGKRTTL